MAYPPDPHESPFEEPSYEYVDKGFDFVDRWHERREKDKLNMKDRNILTPEVEQKAKSLLTGTTTSAVKQTWGCGHSVWSVNGDSLYSTCPICFVNKLDKVES